VDQNYYLFLYAQKPIQIDFLYQEIDVIQELDSKKRKIRSLRGFFLYALEIIQNAENYEISQTNLQPFFWRKVKNIIRQNKKGALLEFLFGKDEYKKSNHQGSTSHLQDQIANLQNSYEVLRSQVERLQDRIHDLETTLENSKYALSDSISPTEPRKITQQGDSTSKSEKGAYFDGNDLKRSPELREVDKIDSNILSKAPKSPLYPLSNTQQYNLPSNQEKSLSEANFITLGTIPEQEKIEIIQTGFQRQSQGIISLKKYYQSTDPNSLFQLKGYNIKYESIRRTTVYQSLKE
jgi:hypothetical protein